MKDAVTDGRIIVNGPVAFQRISDFQIDTNLGTHTEMKISGYLSEEEPWGMMLSYLEGQEIAIKIREEQNREANRTIFTGIIKRADVETESGYTKATIYGISATWRLDQIEKSRSFQDVSLTYGEIVRMVLQENGEGEVVICDDTPVIEHPVYQYRETDWEFLQRIAGYCHCYLFPESCSGKVRFYFGMRNGQYVGDYSEYVHTIGLDQRYYEFNEFIDGYIPERNQFIYRTVERNECGEIGDRVTFEGKELYICQKACRLEKGILKYICQLADKVFVTAPKRYHQALAGISMDGIVLDTTDELIKLHLLIDKSQDPGRAYWYQWVPETGNLQYCMPEIGSRVTLYFGSEEENSAKCIRCVRTNGTTCGEIQNPENRYFTTKHQKRLALEPGEMQLTALNVKAGLQIQMTDQSGITFYGHNKVNFIAKGDVRMKGASIQMNAGQEVSIVKLGGAAVNMNNRFDATGVKAGVRAGAAGMNFPYITSGKKKRAGVQGEISAQEDTIWKIQPMHTSGNVIQKSVVETQIQRIGSVESQTESMVGGKVTAHIEGNRPTKKKTKGLDKQLVKTQMSETSK